MKKSVLLAFFFGLMALGAGPLAAAAETAAKGVSPATEAKPATSPTTVPTPKPLYVDYQPPDWAKDWEHVTFEKAKKYHTKRNILFCDARAKSEYDDGHIPGAIPLPAGEADKYYAMYEKKIKRADKLVTYCHGVGCRLSEKAAKFLVEKGHKNVAVFFGGWPQWMEHKMPVEKGDPYAPKVKPTRVPTPAPSPAPTADAVAKPAADKK
ncbi:MAG: rhodanese-like domain-containing protein [candidate division FCPU426 bacterium]